MAPQKVFKGAMAPMLRTTASRSMKKITFCVEMIDIYDFRTNYLLTVVLPKMMKFSTC